MSHVIAARSVITPTWLIVVGLANALIVRRAPESLSKAEHARARTFLLDQKHALPTCTLGAFYELPCAVQDHGDVDADGVADCWRIEVAGPADVASLVMKSVERELRFFVWPGCRASAIELEVSPWDDMIGVPASLTSPPWLLWITTKLTGEAGDFGNDPAWRWVIDAADRIEFDETMVHGSVARAWQSGRPRPASTRALIVPHVRVGWFDDTRAADDPMMPSFYVSPAGARIVTFPDEEARASDTQCAGLEITAIAGGIAAWDPKRDRWTWLFHRFPSIDRYAPFRELRCRDDLVVATTGHSVAVIDPVTGDWLYEAEHRWFAHHSCGGASAWDTPDGWVLWKACGRYGETSDRAIPGRTVRSWLSNSPKRAPDRSQAQPFDPMKEQHEGRDGSRAEDR